MGLVDVRLLEEARAWWGVTAVKLFLSAKSWAALEVRKPVRNSSESPGRKKPKNRPDSAKMIAATIQIAAAPAFSSQNSGFRKFGPTARIRASTGGRLVATR